MLKFLSPGSPREACWKATLGVVTKCICGYAKEDVRLRIHLEGDSICSKRWMSELEVVKR